MSLFKLTSSFDPAGDQPKSIERITDNFLNGSRRELMLGATGTGKTFVMANIIKNLGIPTLVLAHNKTLAGQLYGEFKQFFPENKVGYFISYYDYYQPEAYIPTTDTYIEKDASRNDDIDRMRHVATSSLIEGGDCVIVASVSCIYGIGSPETYSKMSVPVYTGQVFPINEFAKALTEIQYERTPFDLSRGKFRVRGDVVEIMPATAEKEGIRIEWFDDDVQEISFIDTVTGKKIRNLNQVKIFPSSHYVAEKETQIRTVEMALAEMENVVKRFKKENKLIEAQRIEERVRRDMAMLESTGYCSGIENYSRFLTGRNPGEAPPTLIDYFGKEFLLIVDESHVTLPQVRAMYNGDRSRKETLVNFGFRLPSALDNRPLKFDEFESRIDKVLFVSATPAAYEKDTTKEIIELINRPTGLLDPAVTIMPAKHQVDSMFDEIKKEIAAGGKVLVTALTKKMAEDVADFLSERGVRSKYLHSDIDSIERLKIIMELRKSVFDVLVGVNLLREGLDIPEVSLVAVLDADKEGFLRSTQSLIQTMGRAARNEKGRVILFADKITDSMKNAVGETERRRKIQSEFNTLHGITPKSISGKAILEIDVYLPDKGDKKKKNKADKSSIMEKIAKLEQQMLKASTSWDFETAAMIRDKIFEYKAEITDKK